MTNHLTDVERALIARDDSLSRLLFVIAGPSGVGKNTIIRRLLTKHPESMGRMLTYTTRSRRVENGEVEGEQYHFVSKLDFIELAKSGILMEINEKYEGYPVYGTDDWYSMPSNIYQDVSDEKHLVIAEVDFKGMRLLRTYVKKEKDNSKCITIFVTATSKDLLERIAERPDDHMNSKEIIHRLNTACEQVQEAGEFDYFLVNKTGELEYIVEMIDEIIRVERMRVREGITLEPIMPAADFKLSPEEASAS